MIDTAGKYAIPFDQVSDTEEWSKFLKILITCKKKGPINGIIVTIAADKLLLTLPESLEEDGWEIRKRLDDIIQATRVKVPVYVLITKCDLIQGIPQFCNNLSENSLNEPMGIINSDFTSDIQTFHD